LNEKRSSKTEEEASEDEPAGEFSVFCTATREAELFSTRDHADDQWVG
jgi:hypothetical protein